jgi:hypothetical protein
MNWGTRAQFYKEFLNTFRKGHWGEKGKMVYETLPQEGRNKIKDIVRAMSEDKIKHATKNPLVTDPLIDSVSQSSKSDILSYASYNMDKDAVKLPPFVLKYPETIPHELRHAQVFREAKLRNRPYIFEMGDDLDPNYYSYNVHVPGHEQLGKKSVWDYIYKGRSSPLEVDAMLSEKATDILAKGISDARKIKKTGSAASPQQWLRSKSTFGSLGGQEDVFNRTWDLLPDRIKSHYLETASIAGLGFLSEPKEQGEEEKV